MQNSKYRASNKTFKHFVKKSPLVLDGVLQSHKRSQVNLEGKTV